MKAVIVVLLTLMLSSCASWQQGINGFESAALVSAKAADDNAIRLWSAAACATPYSAAVRNPQIIPALKVLCAPSTLLDATK